MTMLFYNAVAGAVLSLLFSAAVLANSASLQDFYEHPELRMDSLTFNASDLCYQKWKNTFKRFADGYHPEMNGRTKSKILLVHVGKTAGGAIRASLQNAKINHVQVHIHAVDEQMLRGREVVLLALRDPVHRLVSAFNYHNPLYTPVTNQEWIRKEFYDCFATLDQYASSLTDTSKCGMMARIGELHIELDTCAYLGGVVHLLTQNSLKVFAIDAATVVADLNAVSKSLGWGKSFPDIAHVHEYSHSTNITHLSASSLMQLTGYTEMTGEAALYRELIRLYRPI